MKWRKSLFVVTLVGMMVFAMVSCGKAGESTTTAGQPAPTPGVTAPAPPQGVTPGERPPAPAIDYAAAAAKLGVTEQQLRDALGEMGQKPPDLAAAAAQLGVSEESLREALGLPEGGPPPGGTPPGSPPSGSPPAGSPGQ